VGLELDVIRGKTAALHPVANRLAQQGLETLLAVDQRLPRLAGERLGLLIGEQDETPHLIDPAQEGVEHVVKHLLRVGAGAVGVGDLPAQGVDQLLAGAVLLFADDVKEDILFILEIGERRAGANPRPSGDVAGGGAVKPLFEEQRESRLGHRLPLLLQQVAVTDEKVGFLRRTEDFTRHYSSLLDLLPPYSSW